MSLENIMQKELVCASSSDSVKDVARLLAEKKIGAALIGVPESPEGIFTERDILTKIVAQGVSIENTKVGEVMTKNPISISVDKTPEDALRIMSEKRIRHLPVENSDGKTIGMVSVRTLMEHLLEKMDVENESLSAMLSADGIGG